MLYNLFIEQLSQRMVFHELLMNSSVCISSVILYVKCSFTVVAYVFSMYCSPSVRKNLLYIECTRYSCNILLIYVQVQ
jgi:hypothetical protein